MSKILISDYNSKELQRLKQLFEKKGFEVITANDGPSVIAKFEEEKPDIILLSAMLSRKNGLEVCKKIKMSPDGASVPIIIATSIYKGKNYQMKAKIDYKADEYVEKPIPDEKLVELIEKHIKKDFFSEEVLAETASRRKHNGKKEDEKETTPPKLEKKMSDTDDLDKLISETLSGLGMDIKAKRKREVGKEKEKEKKLEEKLVEEKKVKLEEKEEEKPAEVKKEEKVVEPKKAVKEKEEKKEVEKKKVKMDTDAEVDALLKDTLSLALDIDKDTIKEEKAKKGKDTGELMLEKLKEEVVKKEEKSEGEKAVEKILSSFDTDIEKKLSDTLHGVGLSDTNLEKTLEPREEEVEEEKEEEGIKFGDYYLVEKIGHGGMAELFKAKKKGEKGFQKILAIKRILPHLSDNKELVTMFIDEAKLAAQLSHQNIATIFDFGKIDNSYYIAMEYVDGFDLKKILSKAKELKVKIPHKLAAYIAEQICSALDYAHHKKDYKGKDLKIVHRDVSPQNILISKEGEVKLVDFGISKAESKIHHTVKGALKGKLLYMSPEQAWGKEVDSRSDVYSMGIVLCEMVSGKVLFEDSSEYDVLEKVRSGKMPILDNEIGRVPPKLRKIIKKSLEIDIEKRYQTAAEMAADLRKYINESKPVPTSKDLRTFLTRLYPDQFGLKPEEVKNLTFDDFMEEFEGESLLAEDTIILPEEKVDKVKEKAKVKVTESPKVEKEKPKKKVVVKKKVVKKPIQKKPAMSQEKQTTTKEIPKKAVKKEEKPIPKKVKKTVVTKKLKKEEPPKVELRPSFGAEEKKEGGKNKIIIIAALVVIVIGVVLFLVFGGGGKGEVKKPVKVATNVSPMSSGEEQASAVKQNNIVNNNNIKPTSNQTKPVQNIKQSSKTLNKVSPKPVRKIVKNIKKKVTPAKKNLAKPIINKPKKVVKSKPPQNKPAKNIIATQNKKEAINKPETKPVINTQPSKEVQNKPVTNNPPKQITIVHKPKNKEVKPKPVVTKPKPEVVVEKPKVVTSKPVSTLPSKNLMESKNVIREGDLVPLDSSVNPPIPIKNPRPDYPSKARMLRAHATVIARILINHLGDVEKVRIITVIPSRNRPLFRDSVITSLRKWKFKPAVKDGVKVRVWKTVRVRF